MKKIIRYTLIVISTLMHTHTTYSSLIIRSFSGEQARPYTEEIAQIRITLFSEYPYLYQGTIADETPYLETYFSSRDAHILLVFDGDRIVGFSNCIPLEQETETIKNPFREQGLNLHDYLYIGEVMLYPSYRGQGILRKFFAFHEEIARTKKYPYTVFMTVDRPLDHPLKPANYIPLDAVWHHFGYTQMADLSVHLAWRQVDTHQETNNTLSLWQKKIALKTN